MDYIRRGSPDSARRVAKTIYDLIMSLATFPHKGHKGKPEDGYEMVCTPWSYVIIYEIIGEGIFIQGIIHTSRNRPL